MTDTTAPSTAVLKTTAAGSVDHNTDLRATSGHKKPASSHHRPAAAHHQRAANQAVKANTTHLDFHLGDTEVCLEGPPLDKLAFYAGLTGAAALGVIEWPVALITGIGHLLSDDRRNRTLRALGEALDAAA